MWGVSLIGKTIALQAIVRGSIPLPSTTNKLHGSVAQLVERMPEEHRVFDGSIPSGATKLCFHSLSEKHRFYTPNWVVQLHLEAPNYMEM